MEHQAIYDTHGNMSLQLVNSPVGVEDAILVSCTCGWKDKKPYRHNRQAKRAFERHAGKVRR